MIDRANVPAVDPDETLARYVLQSNHIRRSNQTVRPDAFMPHPYNELSITRHLMATENELWAVGEDVAQTQGKTLYGRADVQAGAFVAQGLAISATPLDDNPNHADVSAWPADKPAQKIIAQEIAAVASFMARP